jgi:lipopolysaccharide transport system ATP-binding protein
LPQLSDALGTTWLNHGLAIVRDPAAVVASIGYRDDMPPLKALALWLRHNLELVDARHLHSTVATWPLLSFERLLSNPEAELEPALQQWQDAGLAVSLQPQHDLSVRELPGIPQELSGIPPTWLELARHFCAALNQSHSLGDVPEDALTPVRQLLDGNPELSQRLLALEAKRRSQLGELLAQERRGQQDPGLLGDDDLAALEADHSQSHAKATTDATNAYVQLQQVCIDLRGRGQRRSFKSLLNPPRRFTHQTRPQGPSGLRPLALDHIDLNIGHGERVGLLGHNGSGKTTLLRLLGGIYSPTGGRIHRDGPALAPVIEQSLGFSQELTGLQLARYSYKLHRAGVQSWEEYRNDLESFTELGDALGNPIKTWSLGMRTRLSFALITFRDVQGLALDEGLAAGDQWFQRKARSHLDQFIADAGTLVLASHSEDLLRRYCTRGVILERGRVRYDGSLYRALQLYRGELH